MIEITKGLEIRFKHIKIEYNINVIRQTACMVINPTTVNNFASLWLHVGGSDSMMAPA